MNLELAGFTSHRALECRYRPQKRTPEVEAAMMRAIEERVQALTSDNRKKSALREDFMCSLQFREKQFLVISRKEGSDNRIKLGSFQGFRASWKRWKQSELQVPFHDPWQVIDSLVEFRKNRISFLGLLLAGSSSVRLSNLATAKFESHICGGLAKDKGRLSPDVTVSHPCLGPPFL